MSPKPYPRPGSDMIGDSRAGKKPAGVGRKVAFGEIIVEPAAESTGEGRRAATVLGTVHTL